MRLLLMDNRASMSLLRLPSPPVTPMPLPRAPSKKQPETREQASGRRPWLLLVSTVPHGGIWAAKAPPPCKILHRCCCCCCCYPGGEVAQRPARLGISAGFLQAAPGRRGTTGSSERAQGVQQGPPPRAAAPVQGATLRLAPDPWAGTRGPASAGHGRRAVISDRAKALPRASAVTNDGGWPGGVASAGRLRTCAGGGRLS